MSHSEPLASNLLVCSAAVCARCGTHLVVERVERRSDNGKDVVAVVAPCDRCLRAAMDRGERLALEKEAAAWHVLSRERAVAREELDRFRRVRNVVEDLLREEGEGMS